jgi:hypothetical protein
MAVNTVGSESASLRQGSTTVTGQSGIGANLGEHSRLCAEGNDKTVTLVQVTAGVG